MGEQLDDVLGDIERVLTTPPPPLTGWSSIPPAKASIDDLAAIAEMLEQDREASEPDLIEAFAHSQDGMRISVEETPDIALSMETDDGDWDEPTSDWAGQSAPPKARDSFASAPIPPPARSAAFLSSPDFGPMRDEMPSLVDAIDDASQTLRPSAVSLPPYRPATSSRARRRRIPTGLALAAVASIGAAVVSYRLGPHSSAEPTGHVAAATQRVPSPLVVSAPEQVPEVAEANDATERLLVTLSPPEAYLSIRTLSDREGKKTTGPWPKVFHLAPGEYELVAFRAGRKSIVRRITIEPGVRPAALEMRLRVDDIYE